MYLTSSTGLILYSSEWQKKGGGIYYNAEKCQQSQSHGLDPCSCRVWDNLEEACTGHLGSLRVGALPCLHRRPYPVSIYWIRRRLFHCWKSLESRHMGKHHTSGDWGECLPLSLETLCPECPEQKFQLYVRTLVSPPLSNTVLLLMFMTIELYWWTNKTNWKLNFFFLRALTLNSNSLHAWAYWVSFRRYPAITI